MDSVVKDSLSRLEPSDLISSNLDLTSFHTLVKAFHPNLTMKQVSANNHYLDDAPWELKEKVLSDLQRNGYLPHLSALLMPFLLSQHS